MTRRPVERVVHDPRFERLVPADAELEWLADGALWAEGPVYVPGRRRGHLERRPRATSSGAGPTADGATDLYRPSDFANGHTLDHDGTVLACEHGTRRIARYERDGSRTTVVDRYRGQAAQLAQRHRRRLGRRDLVHRSAVRDPRRLGGLHGRLGAGRLLRLPVRPGDRRAGDRQRRDGPPERPRLLARRDDPVRVGHLGRAARRRATTTSSRSTSIDRRRLAAPRVFTVMDVGLLGRPPGRRRGEHLDLGRRRHPRPRCRRRRAWADRPPRGREQLHLRRRRTAGGCSSRPPRPCGRSTSASAGRSRRGSPGREVAKSPPTIRA